MVIVLANPAFNPVLIITKARLKTSEVKLFKFNKYDFYFNFTVFPFLALRVFTLFS